jgi:hypothetical protein
MTSHKISALLNTKSENIVQIVTPILNLFNQSYCKFENHTSISLNFGKKAYQFFDCTCSQFPKKHNSLHSSTNSFSTVYTLKTAFLGAKEKRYLLHTLTGFLLVVQSSWKELKRSNEDALHCIARRVLPYMQKTLVST